MQFAILRVVIAYLVVAAAEAYLHWYAGTQHTSTADSLKEWYLYHDPRNDKAYHEGSADLILPAIALGLAAGGVTARRAQRELIWFALLLASGVVALFPLYAVFFPQEPRQWWSSATSGEKVGAFIVSYFKAALFCLFFGGVGRNLARYFQRLTPDVG